MPSLEKNLRKTLENTVKAARKVAEAGGLEAVNALAVGEKEAFAHMGPDEKALRNRLRARGRAAGDVRDASSGKQTVEHLVGIVAYEHWHRMLFARLLAENGLLLEPEHQVPVSLEDVEELARDEGMDVWELAGRYAEKMLPQIFRSDDPALEVDLARESRVKLERLLADLPRNVFTADDSLGWVYQFWQADEKERVNKSGVKIGADELPAVTQLFTEDYMVEFLLHNTLGAWWAGKLGPIEAADEEGARAVASLDEKDGLGVTWTYLRFVQDEDTKHWTPTAGVFDGWPKTAKEITFLDPCMGSGHFLVFALPILARMRMEEENLGVSEAVHAVLRDNLHGLEIDPRCSQIAAFNVALAAWKLGGYQQLPELHLACCGLAPRAKLDEWLKLAEEAAQVSALPPDRDLLGDKDETLLSQKLKAGMNELYHLFKNAPVLGSLINPRVHGGDLFVSGFNELQPLLTEAMNREYTDSAEHEIAVTARGLAKAAEILAGQFTFVATNVPYLGRGKQDEVLTDYCDRVHPDAKADLAACFIERCFGFCGAGGSSALVTPQSWLFQSSYRRLREQLLKSALWDMVARLGAGAFETISGEVVNVALVCKSRQSVTPGLAIAGYEVEKYNLPSEKASGLVTDAAIMVSQQKQLTNPHAKVVLSIGSIGTALENFAETFKGICSGDGSHFQRYFWEIETVAGRPAWAFQQGAIDTTTDFHGRDGIFLWEKGEEGGEFYSSVVQRLGETGTSAWIRGRGAWGRDGVVIRIMKHLPVTRYTGQIYDNNVAVVVPKNRKDLPAVWAFCSSDSFNVEVRKLNQKLSVTDESFVQVPFDLARWQKFASEKYPNGLPKPYSSDPTQWLFTGQPAGADQPLQVAVARLLGYQWPRQTGSSFPECPALELDGLEKLADEDGIVCLPALNRESSAAERLRAMLAGALGPHDEHQLLKQAGAKAKNLENWLRDEFFEQHCKLFHQRPFIWHIWDGRPDGFHALVNYHRLATPDGEGHKLLESLTYSYLGDWIRKQKAEADHGTPGAEDRLIAAEALQGELKNILAGEPSYDIFVRWKPLHQQAIGWNPDINDGVRLNIRPFLYAKDVKKKGAGILRTKPGSIKWTKDRGKEPQRPKEDFPWFWSWDEKTKDFMGGDQFDANRWNDLHYTNAIKQAARDRKENS